MRRRAALLGLVALCMFAGVDQNPVSAKDANAGCMQCTTAKIDYGWTCSGGENWWHSGNAGPSYDLAQMSHTDYRCGGCDNHASCGLALEATRELDESLNDPAAIKDVLERYPAHLALDVAAGGIAIFDCAGSEVDFAPIPAADLARVVALNS